MNFKYFLVLLFGLVFFMSFALQNDERPAEFLNYKFKGKNFQLTFSNRFDTTRFSAKSPNFEKRLDSLSNVFYQEKNYIEIIRQDFSMRPTVGVAMGFEFEEANGEYPYSPAHAVLQLKDFRYGGVMFEKRDSMNFTGVSNDVSDDLDIQIEGFENDTIFGTFQGLLINAAGGMAQVSDGKFRVRLVRR